MLKKSNKRNIYILLPLVITIWGVIFFKLFLGTGNNVIEKPSTNLEYEKLVNDTTVATYKLDLSYEDPFLGQKKKQMTPKQTNSGTKNMAINNEEFSFPDISYSGFVKNEKSAMAYLILNGYTVFAETNKEYYEVKILDILPDSVLIEYKNKKKWILK